MSKLCLLKFLIRQQTMEGLTERPSLRKAVLPIVQYRQKPKCPFPSIPFMVPKLLPFVMSFAGTEMANAFICFLFIRLFIPFMDLLRLSLATNLGVQLLSDSLMFIYLRFSIKKQKRRKGLLYVPISWILPQSNQLYSLKATLEASFKK